MLNENLLPYDEYIKSNSKYAYTVSNWVKQSKRSAYYMRGVVISDELVEYADSAGTTLDVKLMIISKYSAPIMGLTDEDYKKYIEEEIRAQGGRPTFYYYGSSWQAKTVAARSGLGGDWQMEGLIDEHIAYLNSDKKEMPALEKYIYLNEYLSEQNVEKTFGEYIAAGPKDDEFAARLKSLVLKSTTWRKDLITFGAQRNVATIDHKAQVRTKKLLFSQDQNFWNDVIVNNKWRDYRKGKTHQHVEKFVKEIINGKEKAKNIESVQAEFYALIGKKVSEALRTFPDEKYVNVANIAFKVPIISERMTIKNNLEEWSYLLEKLTAEDQDLKITLGIIAGMLYPRTWIRGTGENGLDLMIRLFKSEHGHHYMEHISNIVFEHYADIPSETEWVKSLNEDTQIVPTEMFLILTAQPRTKGKHRACSEYVTFLRSLKA